MATANHPVAVYAASGDIVSATGNFVDKTLCVQQIVSGEKIFF